MAVPDPETFLSRVQRNLHDLHPQERKLADLILNFPGQLAGYTASEIAELAQVSGATVSRFVRKIGYRSFDEARQAVRVDQDAGSALLRLREGGQQGADPVATFVEQSQDNIRKTLGALDPAALDALARRIATAPRVWIIGYRAGQPFARYLGWQVSQIVRNVDVLPRDGETLAESLGLVAPQDCVILFALRRAPAIARRILDVLAERGVPPAIIGDNADIVGPGPRFHCVTASVGPLFNHVAVMALCNLLATRVIELADGDSRAHMRDIERAHSLLREL